MESATYSVKLKALIDEFKLELLRGGEGYENTPIVIEDVNRPGLQLTGFFDHFDPQRIELLGLVECTYLGGISPQARRDAFDKLFSYPIPALIITRSLEPYPECLEMAEKYDRTILRTSETTSSFMSGLIGFLNNSLAPRITRHGVLLEIYGEGVLLLGESGIGKSETAIELVKRGHRLIADDAVDIKRTENKLLVGTAPALIRHYIELRGIGVVDVRQLFGMGAVKEQQEIDLIINLEHWRNDKIYDRLGVENLYTEVLDVQIPTLTVPVQPGRNLAVIIEVAAMNNRPKKMGYNAALAFTQQINQHFDQALSQQNQEKGR